MATLFDLEKLNMIKECPVIINNKALSVVNFDGIDIQFPPIGRNVKTLNVKFEDGKYTIVKDAEKEEKKVEPVVVEEQEAEVEKKPKKTIKKKNVKVEE